MRIKKIIDISRKIYPGMVVWPGDKGVSVDRTISIQQGDTCNVSVISAGVHTGTHTDAPLHFIDKACDISETDLDRYIGMVKVFEISSTECVSVSDVKNLPIQAGDAVIFKTQNSEIPIEAGFNTSFIYIDYACAQWLVNTGVKTVGIDYLSVERFESQDYEVHKLLLANKVAIIEGLCLKDVDPGEYFLSALPLAIKNSDGSPVRAVLLEI